MKNMAQKLFVILSSLIALESLSLAANMDWKKLTEEEQNTVCEWCESNRYSTQAPYLLRDIILGGQSKKAPISLLIKACNSLDADHGQCPLIIWAAQKDAPEATKELLKANAAINVRDKEYQRTALMWAAAHKNTDTLQVLIENKADLTLIDKKGYSAVRYAIENKSSETLKLLVEGGAPFTNVDFELALKRKDKKSIQYLKELVELAKHNNQKLIEN